MNTCVYYGLQVYGLKMPPANLHCLMEHNELHVSTTKRLCGSLKMAHIENIKIAEQFRAICYDVLVKRYKQDISLDVISCTERGSNLTPLYLRIAKDTDVIKKVIKEHKSAIKAINL